jgi:hypothetical protein
MVLSECFCLSVDMRLPVNLKATRCDAGRTPAPQDVHVRRDELHDVLVNKTRYYIKLKGNLFSSISEISCVAGGTLPMLLSLFVDDRALVFMPARS